jgi:hypothetical protein
VRHRTGTAEERASVEDGRRGVLRCSPRPGRGLGRPVRGSLHEGGRALAWRREIALGQTRYQLDLLGLRDLDVCAQRCRAGRPAVGRDGGAGRGVRAQPRLAHRVDLSGAGPRPACASDDVERPGGRRSWPGDFSQPGRLLRHVTRRCNRQVPDRRWSSGRWPQRVSASR